VPLFIVKRQCHSTYTTNRVYTERAEILKNQNLAFTRPKVIATDEEQQLKKDKEQQLKQ